MIIGLGIDIVDVERLGASVRHYGDRFIRRIFTDNELSLSHNHGNSLKLYASGFACKEAAMKALGTGWTEPIDWRHFEILYDATGMPDLRLHGSAANLAVALGVVRCWACTASTPRYSVAQVVLEGEP